VAALRRAEPPRVREWYALVGRPYDPAVPSPIMDALYNGRREHADRLAADAAALDVFEASSLGLIDVLERLLAADPGLATAWSDDGFTALHFAAFFGGGADVARALLRAGADPDARSRNEMSVAPLNSAAAGGHDDVVEALLAAGADPNVRQRHGWVPLHAAAENGDEAMVERLLAAGARTSESTDDGRTPLDLARAAGHDGIARRLGGGAA
jgi:ankyrin repeat protein